MEFPGYAQLEVELVPRRVTSAGGYTIATRLLTSNLKVEIIATQQPYTRETTENWRNARDTPIISDIETTSDSCLERL